MKLTIINGSPRGKKSNSKVISDWFINKLPSDSNLDVFYALDIQRHQQFISSLQNNQTILIIFPLYTDSMPFVLKKLFESMNEIRNKLMGVRIYYCIHSGFLGASHSRSIESYLIYFSNYMGFQYLGSAIKPSSEGLRMMPKYFLNHTRKVFESLADDLFNLQPFNANTLKKLILFEKPTWLSKKLLRFGIGKMYFNRLLKMNHSYQDRYNKPYERRSE